MQINGFGLGLRPSHYAAILEESHAIDWLEIITENYLVPGRQAAPLSRAHSQPLSHGHARRLAVHRQHRSPRPGVSRRRARAGAAHRARLDLRSPVLDRRRGAQRARSAALALHRGSARLRGRPRRRGSGSTRPTNSARERLELSDIPLLGDDRVGILERSRVPRRLCDIAGYQQYPRERRESRVRGLALPARRSDRNACASSIWPATAIWAIT